MYDNGHGVIQDYKQAVNWYTKAAQQGHAEAQSNLGFMYSNGRGVTRDYKQAVNWYTKAAEQGDTVAQYNLGVMYRNGRGVTRDYKQAVNWYAKAECVLEAWSRVAASGGAACVSGWELQLPTDGRPLPVPQSNAYSHSFERESKTILTRAFTKYP